jgi:predicted outer membrane repeat protein
LMNGTINIADSAFLRNKTKNEGGAIYNQNSSATINGGTAFYGNSADNNGGAIYNNNGILNLNSTTGNIIFGDSAFGLNTAAKGNDIYSDNTTVNVNGTANDVVINSGIAGTGTIAKTNGGRFLINADSSGYTGTFNSTGGETIVSSAGKMFAGTNNVAASTLQVTGDNVYYNANLGDSGVLKHYNTTGTAIDINNTAIKFTGANAAANFGKDAGLKGNAAYTLTGKFDNGSANTVNFTDSDVTISAADLTGSTTYSFNNSVVDLSTNNTKTVEFDNFNASGSALNFGIKFDKVNGDVVLNADQMKVNNPTTGTIAAGIIKVLNDNDNGRHKTYNTEVLTGGLEFNSILSQTVATKVYKYKAAMNAAKTGITLTAMAIADENTLYTLNGQYGDRSFSFTSQPTTYHIGQSLGATAFGNFKVEGYDNDPSHSIISGVIVNSSGTPTGAKGSFFNLIEKTDLTLSNLTIQDAYISGNGSVLRIINADAAAVLSNVIIQNNSATNFGGAIHNLYGNVTISNSSFNANKAGNNGGAIYNYNGNLTIDKVTFTENTAVDGSAVFSSGGNISITDSVFTKNNFGVAGNKGSALSSYNGTVTINGGTSFTENIANNGGAIFNGSNGYVTITGDQNIFAKNQAEEDGGAIFNLADNGHLTVDKVVFTENTAAMGGGAIYNNSSSSTITNGTIFIKNTANIGSAILNHNGTVTINGGTVFTENEASYSGTVGNMGGGTINITDSFFIKNKTVNEGGAIYNYSGTVTINGGTSFTENTSASGGAIFNQNSSSVSITGDQNIFTDNKATVSGGAIFNERADVTISGRTTFYNNSADSNGGAIMNDNGDVKINDETTFYDNSANGSGGAIYNQNSGDVTINGGTTFYSNSANGGGGAIYNQNSGDVTINGTTFYDNSASGNGGAIYNEKADLTISGGTIFYDNNAGGSGGAIMNDNGDVTINSGTIFYGNSADGYGGAIYNNNGTVNLNSTAGNIIFGDSTWGLNMAADNTGLTYANDIHNDGIVNITGDNGLVSISSGIIGTGIINKTGSGELVLRNTSQNSDFTGDFNQSAGATYVENGASFFTGNVGLTGNSSLHLAVLAINNLAMDSGLVNVMNNSLDNHTANNLSVGENGASFAVDLEPLSRTSDTFTFGAIDLSGAHGTITIADFNPGAYMAHVKDKEIPFQIFNTNNINMDVEFAASDKKVKSAIGIYRLFPVQSEIGKYVLSMVDFNPEVFRGQVASMAVFNNQLIVNDNLFDHIFLDSEFSSVGSLQANRYAAGTEILAPYQHSKKDGSIWFKNYVTFERLSMSHGLNVGNNVWGTLVGADFPVQDLKDGWKFLPTAYIGYNGGHQTYDGVSMYQNGGQAGAMGTFMKNDFTGSVLAYAGGYSNEMSVSSFQDQVGNWFAGAAVKGAYNFHPTKNLIIQPTLMATYNIFGSQRWGSDYGALSMNSGFLNGINVAPGLNLIYSKDTWNIYGTVQYFYYINDKINGSAGSISLPNIHMNHGYLQYGIGATKVWKDRLTGYLQIVLRNGGRTGVGFQLGASWKF